MIETAQLNWVPRRWSEFSKDVGVPAPRIFTFPLLMLGKSVNGGIDGSITDLLGQDRQENKQYSKEAKLESRVS